MSFFPSLSGAVSVADPDAPSHVIKPNADGSINVGSEALAFLPGATVTIAVTSVTGRVQLGLPLDAQVVIGSPVTSPAIAFIAFGTAGIEATTADYPIFPGTKETLSPPAGATHMAAITAASTATLYATSGVGQ